MSVKRNCKNTVIELTQEDTITLKLILENIYIEHQQDLYTSNAELGFLKSFNICLTSILEKGKKGILTYDFLKECINNTAILNIKISIDKYPEQYWLCNGIIIEISTNIGNQGTYIKLNIQGDGAFKTVKVITKDIDNMSIYEIMNFINDKLNKQEKING